MTALRWGCGARRRSLRAPRARPAAELTALTAAGRSVPQDVAVGGFDDSGLAATLQPPLTTMRQPFERIAREMVRLLVEVVEGQEIASITLPTTLVQRSST